MMHHGLIPHFSLEKVLFSAYVIDDWNNICSQFADLGMKAVFTGHFHAQDIVEQKVKSHGIYDIETGSLVTYPCPYRMITLTNRKMEIKTETIRDIDFDTKGKPFPQYAADFLTKGLSELVPHFLAGLLVSQKISINNALTETAQLEESRLTSSCTVRDLAVDAFKSHYVGDEVFDESRSNIVSAMKASSDLKLKLVGNVIYSLYNDPPPADNNVTLNLSPE